MPTESEVPVNPSRRQFLATGAGGAAGLLLSSNAPASTPPVSTPGAEITTTPHIASPAWAKDLIIYEIATKGFTSPTGPESGTFNSLKERIPYLHDLGVDGIWLRGDVTSSV